MLLYTSAGCLVDDGGLTGKTRDAQEENIVVNSHSTTTTIVVSPTLPQTPSTTYSAITSTIPDEIPESRPLVGSGCDNHTNLLNRSVCLFDRAVRENNKSICTLITHAVTRELCLERAGIEDNPSTIVSGVVMRKTPSEPLGGLDVIVTSRNRGVSYKTTTRPNGRYYLKVHGGDSYVVTVEYDGNNFSQYLDSNRNWEYHMDFIIST